MSDYATPLGKMTDLMAQQLALPENAAKVPWTECTVEQLDAELERNLAELRSQTWSGSMADPEVLWRRAANVGNIAWMIADRVTSVRTG